MSYGFSAINNNDIVVIDQDYQNYALHSTVSISKNNCSYGYFQNNFGHWYYTLYIPNIPGIIAFTDSTYYLSCYGSLSSSGTNQSIIIPDFYPDFSFNIYFYVPSSYLITSTTTGYGLNVYKNNSELCYSSLLNYTKHDVTHIFSTADSLTLPYTVNASGTKLFELSVFRPMGDYSFQPEGGLYYSGTAMYFGVIDGNNVVTWSEGMAMWSYMQGTGALGSMLVMWDNEAHLYLGAL